MVAAKMRAADVPVEILGLDVKRKGVGEKRVQRLRHFLDRLGREIGRRIERRRCGHAFKLADFLTHESLLVGNERKGAGTPSWNPVRAQRAAAARVPSVRLPRA